MKEILINEILLHKIKPNKDYSKGGFYLIKNFKNNKCYIGKSINYMSRLKQHLFNSNNKLLIDKELNLDVNNFKFYLISEYNEFGIDFFNRRFETLIEQKYIKEFNTIIPNGYNIRTYGHI